MDANSELLQLFRAVMPGVRGVVLAAPDGRPVAHDLAQDPAALAASAWAQHQEMGGVGASTMVAGADGLYLVVFLSQQQAFLRDAACAAR